MLYFSSIGLKFLCFEDRIRGPSCWIEKVAIRLYGVYYFTKPEHLLVNSFHMQFSTSFRMEALESEQLDSKADATTNLSV